MSRRQNLLMSSSWSWPIVPIEMCSCSGIRWTNREQDAKQTVAAFYYFHTHFAFSATETETRIVELESGRRETEPKWEPHQMFANGAPLGAAVRSVATFSARCRIPRPLSRHHMGPGARDNATNPTEWNRTQPNPTEPNGTGSGPNTTTARHGIAGYEGGHSQLRPVRHLQGVQPVEESILRLVLAEEKVSNAPRDPPRRHRPGRHSFGRLWPHPRNRCRRRPPVPTGRRSPCGVHFGSA